MNWQTALKADTAWPSRRSLAREGVPQWLAESAALTAEEWLGWVQQARASLAEHIRQGQSWVDREFRWEEGGALEVQLARMRQRLTWHMPYPEALGLELVRMANHPLGLAAEVKRPEVVSVSLGGELTIHDGTPPLLRFSPLYAPYTLSTRICEEHWLFLVLPQQLSVREATEQAKAVGESPPVGWDTVVCVCPDDAWTAARAPTGWRHMPLNDTLQATKQAGAPSDSA